MRVAVLGGGLQGACVAMELADAGVEVHLYDRNDQCLTQASARNEGKIHLGYVYANDPSLATARLMVQGAITFAPLMRRWIGADVDRIPVSSPFHYVVHRDSIRTIDEVTQHLQSCHKMLQEETHRPIDYFGMDYRSPPILLNGYDEYYDPERVAAVFRTTEIAIDPEVLSQLLRLRLSQIGNVKCVTKANVTAVVARDSALEVCFNHEGLAQREGFDQVVNAAWDGRLAIDATMGLQPPRPWMFRIKHFVRAHLQADSIGLPSSTIVLGPFGDIVMYQSGAMYLSWYPAGLRGRSNHLSPPEWPRDLEENESAEIFSATKTGLSQVVPAVARLNPESWNVKGGVIFAWGSTDIDDPASDLHERARIGPQHFGRYHSINTGKLTVAPLFAKRVADVILGRD